VTFFHSVPGCDCIHKPSILYVFKTTDGTDNSYNWKECVGRIRLNRVPKENLKILVKRERGLVGHLK
jgi:hypothetical protein